MYYFFSKRRTEMSKKNQFVNEFKTQLTLLAQVTEKTSALSAAYFQREYNSGGADVITDEDISSTGMTAADVVSQITLAQQLVNFRDNQAVLTGDYGSTMNRARTDF